MVSLGAGGQVLVSLSAGALLLHLNRAGQEGEGRALLHEGALATILTEIRIHIQIETTASLGGEMLLRHILEFVFAFVVEAHTRPIISCTLFRLIQSPPDI